MNADKLSVINEWIRYSKDDFDDLTKEDAEKSLNITKIIQKFITGKIAL